MLCHDRKRALLARLDDHIAFIHLTPPLPARNGFGTSVSIGLLNYFLVYPLVLSYVCWNCCLLSVAYLVDILHLCCTSFL